MSLIRIAILLQLVGFIFEGIFVSLLYHLVIENSREKIRKFAISCGKLFLPILGGKPLALTIGAITVLLIESLIGFGWVRHNNWLFVIGIILLMGLFCLFIFDKETKKERSEKVFEAFASLFAVIFIIPILMHFFLIIFSLLIRGLASGGKLVENTFLIIGLLLIISGLVMELCVTS
jgi:hypothetical protein